MSIINEIAALVQSKVHLDASESIHFARELEHIRARTFDIKFPEFKGRTLVPVDNSADEGADKITYKQFDQVGKALPAGNYTGKGPRIDVVGREFSNKVEGWRAAYGFTTQDIRRSRLAGSRVDEKRAMAARRAIEEAFDEIAAIGNSDLGMTGIANNASIPLETLPNAGAWAGLTGEKIIENLAFLEGRVVINTIETFIPDTIILDTINFQAAATTRMSVDNTKTALREFLENSPYIKNIESWHRLNTAGAASIRRMIAYKRDPEVLTQNIPMEFTQQPPQWQGLELVIEVEARNGGVEIHYPLALAHADIAV